VIEPNACDAIPANAVDGFHALDRRQRLGLGISDLSRKSGAALSERPNEGTGGILLGNGDGTFQPQADIDIGMDPNWVVVGDFNGDGKLDLAVIDGQGNSYTSAVLILLGNGDGTFTQAGSYPLNTNAASGTTADFNGDGKLDIAIADNIGLVSILLGNGDGTFKPRVDYEIGTFPWGQIALGDFNEDGNLDLAVADGGSMQYRFCSGTATVPFSRRFR
jgi:hypothetical protein